ncbi:RNA 2'-phosphotransferase [Psychroserpens sp.]
MNKTKVSKLISYWLRHNPEDINISLDEYGWANINDILGALNQRKIEFTRDELIELNNSFDKVRWKVDLSTNKIKATHGHSISISQELLPQTPPEILYHGTASKYLESIIANGLSSKNRQYVHLSEDILMATEVGKRHGKPIIIEIDTLKMVKQGFNFYKTEQGVWLTDNILTKYLDFNPWNFNTNDELNKALLLELTKEISDSHVLFKKLDFLKLIATHNQNDDCLFINQKNNELYIIHPTWSGEKETSIWPSTTKFTNFRDWIENRLLTDQKDFY